MPGTVYRALSKTSYDWSSINTSGSITHSYVAKAIDVSAYREATIIARLHAVSILGAGSAPTIKINTYPEAPTPEDPANDFILTSSPTTITFSLTTASTAPQVQLATMNTPFGGWLRVEVQPTQSSTQATQFQATLSVDIVAKS